ncbi:MAG TPA: hypothetical protein DHW82_06270 [Spirochaetia bacterium]|nr:MAG: hypothetical protein A2Y41_01345 [Spirochaetes bacterium GWB1_36_13]HCL56598.1 hypothetical protein [Spirochaetia bacterium]
MSENPIEKYIKEYAAGTIIFEEGAEGSEMYVIKEGVVRIELLIKNPLDPENFERKSLGELQEGEFFGEMTLIDKSPRSARAIAATDCKLIALNKNGFFRLIEHSAEFAIKIVKKLSDRLKESNSRMKKLAQIGKHNKVLQLLKDFLKDEDQVITIEEIKKILQEDHFEEEELWSIIKKLESLSLVSIQKNNTILIQNKDIFNQILTFLNTFNDSFEG